jgi:DNA-binding response OmpR family regulator
MPATRVLIADDYGDIAEVVCEILIEEGYEPLVTTDLSISALLDVVRREKPEFILLDGGSALGYGASWETAAALHRAYPQRRLIMFTADVSGAREARGDATARSHLAGFATVLSKPFSIGDVLAAVRGRESAD